MKRIPVIEWPVACLIIFLMSPICSFSQERVFISSDNEPSGMIPDLYVPKIHSFIHAVNPDSPSRQHLELISSLHVIRKNESQIWYDLYDLKQGLEVLHDIAPLQIGLETNRDGSAKLIGVPSFVGKENEGAPSVPEVSGKRRIVRGYSCYLDFRWSQSRGPAPVQYEVRVGYEITMIENGASRKTTAYKYYMSGFTYVPIVFPGDNDFTISIRARNSVGVSDWSDAVVVTCVSLDREAQ